MVRKIDWSNPEMNLRLLAAECAASDHTPNYRAIANYFGQGATYDAIENRFRWIKAEAAILKAEVESGERPPAPVRSSTTRGGGSGAGRGRGRGGGGSGRGSGRGRGRGSRGGGVGRGGIKNSSSSSDSGEESEVVFTGANIKTPRPRAHAAATGRPSARVQDDDDHGDYGSALAWPTTLNTTIATSAAAAVPAASAAPSALVRRAATDRQRVLTGRVTKAPVAAGGAAAAAAAAAKQKRLAPAALPLLMMLTTAAAAEATPELMEMVATGSSAPTSGATSLDSGTTLFRYFDCHDDPFPNPCPDMVATTTALQPAVSADDPMLPVKFEYDFLED
jgi:hypothetical protein